MRKTVFGCLGAAAVALTLQLAPAAVNAGLFDRTCDPCAEVGEGDCDPCKEAAACDPCGAADCGVKGKGKFFVNGFIESGFWANEYGRKNAYFPAGGGFDTDSGNSSILQNVQHTGYQVNQVYVSAGKSVNGKHGWDFGGTMDFVFGTDARYVQSAGLEKSAGHGERGWGTGDYYSAFAQMYFEAEYKRLNIKAGKFYAPFGAQEFRGDHNFFYSFAPNFDFVPATASGAYATYTVNDRLALVGGWVSPDMYGETSHNNAFLGGAVWQATKKLNLTYFFGAGQIGKEYAEVAPALLVPDDIDYFVNSLVGTYQINRKLKAVVDWSLFNTQVDNFYGSEYNKTAWGLNTALYYQHNQKWAFGVRYNYVSGSGTGYEVNGLYGNFGWAVDEWQAVSLGANWTPAKWLTVKPEIRWDIVDATGGAFSSKNGLEWHKQQFSGGVSTVVKF